jgi:hypothetical protein
LRCFICLLSDYAKDLGAVSASNLGARLKGAVHALYFLVGWEWIVIAIIMLISVFNTPSFKVIVLFCGFALLVTMAVMLAFMGWFVGTYMILASALSAFAVACCFKIPQGSSCFFRSLMRPPIAALAVLPLLRTTIRALPVDEPDEPTPTRDPCPRAALYKVGCCIS